MSDVVLGVDCLARTVGDRAIVDNVYFEVSRGELVTVVGPSGAGKSSLLRPINRIEEPS